VGNAEGRKDFLTVSRVFSGVFWAGITLDHIDTRLQRHYLDENTCQSHSHTQALDCTVLRICSTPVYLKSNQQLMSSNNAT